MESYTLSEKGSITIKKYQNRMIAAGVMALVLGLLAAFLAFALCRSKLFFFSSILLAWLVCLVIIFISLIILLKVLGTEYDSILLEDGDPYLYLEVHHGMMRITNNNWKMYNTNMLNTASAYINMGKYEDALNCISDRYIQIFTLNKKEYIIYLNHRFKSFYGMGKWNQLREEFAQFKKAIEEFQENTHSPKMIVWSENIYEDIRMSIMDYEILTLEGAFFIADMIADIQNRLDNNITMLEEVYLYLQLGNKEMARENYEAAEYAYNQVIKKGNRLWMTEIARQQERVIHERDKDISLIKEKELQAVRMLLNQKNAAGRELVSEIELRSNIVYVLHNEEEIAGVARITNAMRLGEIVCAPEYDNDKNQFRLLQEMKRRGYYGERNSVLPK